MKQKTAALLAALLLVASCSFSALAGGEIEVEAGAFPVEPMPLGAVIAPASLQAEPCDHCGVGEVTYRYDVTSPAWIFDDDYPCTHQHGYIHEVQYKEVSEYYACDSCSYTFTVLSHRIWRTWCTLYKTWLDGKLV